MAELTKREGVAVAALRFVIITAVRTGEARTATWEEISPDAVWTIPATRMKGRREHRVPLSKEVFALLETLPREHGNPHLFIGARNAALGDTALSAALRRAGCDATVHGFRAAFSTWAHEQTAHSNHTIEMCLAHAIGTEVEKAYRRTDLFNKRRALMELWAKFVCSPPVAQTGKVISMQPARR
jgi:integrase